MEIKCCLQIPKELGKLVLKKKKKKKKKKNHCHVHKSSILTTYK